MRFIDLMQLDYANFMLQQSAPELIKHAIAYETKRFAEIMDETNSNLPATETAWRESATKVLAEAARRDPENIGLPRNRPTPDKIYAQMLVDVFTGLEANIPETLQLDAKRIERTRVDLLRIVTTGAILLQCKNLMKRDVRSQWKTEASRVLTVLENAKSADQACQGIQAALESSRSMPAATKKHIKDLVSRIIAAYSSASNGEISQIREPVMRLLLTRLRGHLLGRLAANTEKEKVRATSTASESLATLGLPEFVQKIGSIVDEVGTVGTLDREAHAVWYELVAGAVEAESNSAQAGPSS